MMSTISSSGMSLLCGPWKLPQQTCRRTFSRGMPRSAWLIASTRSVAYLRYSRTLMSGYICQPSGRSGNFRAALKGAKAAEAFLPANTPGTIEHWLRNEHYPSEEAFVEAIAEAMREEYKAIVDAGFLLQIDDPDLPDGWQMYPDMSVREYRKYATLRVDAINHALRGIPREKVRLHVCWGSFHGPHRSDIPLEDIVDIIFRVRASSYSIEASNPVHEHEWRVFEDVKPPEGAVLIPGVVGHCCDFIEHPELVAQRLLRYAKLLGRENVMGGTDCGLGPRVGSPEIAWAKLEALAQGARLASRRLWMRSAKPSRKRAPARRKKAKRR